ncbi:MAG: hypothetical protein JST84_00780 [Acidobacteria bacterium]|nr:hypothetical protein [Acidobacteriota bacterium]
MANDSLAVFLSIPEKQYAIGEAVPVTIEIRNLSAQPIWFVGVMDGSEEGVRYPKYAPQIVGPQAMPPAEPLECGLVSPLRMKDFSLLPPGQGFDPTIGQNGATYFPLRKFTEFRPPSAGRYEFSLTVSTLSQQEEEWLGWPEYDEKAAVLQRLTEVPRVQLQSNVASIEVR